VGVSSITLVLVFNFPFIDRALMAKVAADSANFRYPKHLIGLGVGGDLCPDGVTRGVFAVLNAASQR